MKKVLKTLICVLSCILVLFASAPFAFADDNPIYEYIDTKTFNFPFERPLADDNHFYVEVVYSCYDSSTGTTAYLPYLVTFFAYTDDPARTSAFSFRAENNYCPVNDVNFLFSYLSTYGVGVDLLITAIDCTFSSLITRVSATVYDDNSILFSDLFGGLPEGFKLHSVNVYGSNAFDYTLLLANDCIFNYGSEVNTYDLLTQILSSIHSLTFDSSSGISSSDFDNLLDSINSLSSSQNNASDSLDLILDFLDNKLDSLLQSINKSVSKASTDLTSIRSSLSNIYTTVNSMRNTLTSIYGLQRDQIYPVATEILRKLNRVVELLEGLEGVTVTAPDRSRMDEYYNAEASILDNTNFDYTDSVNPVFDQDSFSFIWSTLHGFIRSNEKVFTVVLTVLSLGIVCLIFGRKV